MSRSGVSKTWLAAPGAGSELTHMLLAQPYLPGLGCSLQDLHYMWHLFQDLCYTS